MKKILVIALLALMGCALNKPVAIHADRCETIASSEEWFKELMKTAAEDLSPATDDGTCPCHETITCKGEVYCSAHKCFDGSIRNPWEVEN
jgi:hypothetical protein